MKYCLFSLLCFLVVTNLHLLVASSQSAGFGGSTTVTIGAGNSYQPTYYIATAGLAGDPVYSGVVANVHDGNNSLTFASEENSTLGINPPFVQGAFNKDILLPRITVGRSGTSVNSVTVDYLGDYSESRNAFVALPFAPEILIDAPDGNGDTAVITSSVDANGKLSATVSSGGSGYNTDPKATIVAGPHFIKITDTTSAHYGRVFLIQNSDTNNTISFGTNLSETQRLTQSEISNSSLDIDDFFDVNMTVEIYPAHTLGSFFGLDIADLPANWEYSQNKDDNNSNKSPTLIYFWNNDLWGFETYFFSTNYRPNPYDPSAYPNAPGEGLSWGWKTRGRSRIIKNNTVIYPDESFLIANRGDAISLTSEGAIETGNKQIFLPEYQNSAILNNPYGTDLMLAELIPSTAVGNGSTQFRPGTDESDGDVITFLNSEFGVWSRYWYKTGENHGVTRMHEIGVRRPLESGSIASTIDADDLYIGSGSVDAMQSCSDATGTTLLSSGNDSNYTKVTISGATSDLTGFTITFGDINGRLLHDDNGSAEASASDPDTELAPGSGSVVFSKLIGSHEIVGSGAGFVVINIQRDVNFIGSGSDAGSPTWSIGSIGAGYTKDARFYLIGGGASANARGTISTIGAITVASGDGGTGYSGKPQVIVSGGGWREGDNSGDAWVNLKCSQILGASSGIFIQRQKTGGEKAFVESINPFE